MEGDQNQDSSFSFKQEPFKITIQSPKENKYVTNNYPINTNIEYFHNEGDSPKFNVIKDQLLNDVSNIPQTELNFKNTLEHEVTRRLSKDKLKPHSPPQRRLPAPDEIEHAKKSHLEYLKIIRDNNDPLGVLSKGIQQITYDELAKHNTTNDLWMAIHGKVFDLTMYLDYHPGGEKMLMKGAGKDATELFNYHHPWINYMSLVGKLQIGVIKK